MIIAVDLDGTLCEEGERWWEYDSCIPKKENIKRLNKEFFPGNHIIIYTSRLHEEEQRTRKWLKKWGVNYHQLVMGKCRAELYIDDRACKLSKEKV
jgi:hydroxymethylpyrimidine pyrophosphatase-like HAD family hydrolase